MHLLDLVGLPFIFSLIISFVATWIVIKLAPTLGIMDDPGKRVHPAKLHSKPIPRGGGLAVFCAILASCAYFLPLDQRLTGIMFGASLVVAIGFLDDRKNLNPYLRLGVQFLAALAVVLSGVGIAFITNPLGGIVDLSHPQISFELLGDMRTIWVLSAIFAFVWIVGLMNAVNWSSGVDGQLSGFAGIAALTIAFLSLSFSADITQWPVTRLAAITSGAFFGFLLWHKYPQKIMPGFGGATLAGYMLAVLSILSTTKVGTLLVVLAIPIIDAAYSIIRRIAQGKSPVWGDRGHLHHRLLDAGWSKRKIAAFYWIGTALLGTLALHLSSKAKFYTMIGIALAIGALILWTKSLLESQKQQDLDNG